MALLLSFPQSSGYDVGHFPSPIEPTPLLLPIQEREQWAALLEAFDHGEYRSKADDFVPSFAGVLDSLPLRYGLALDAGCGSGLLGRTLRRRGWHVEGIDLLPEAVDMAGTVFPVRQGTITDLPYPDAAFDLVLCSMVLMLVDDLAGAVAEMRRVLRPGGWLLVAIVNPAAGERQGTRREERATAGTAVWTFPTRRDIISIRYFQRSLAAYSSALGTLAGADRWTCVFRGGRLRDLAPRERPGPGVEYLWFIDNRAPCSIWTPARVGRWCK